MEMLHPLPLCGSGSGHQHGSSGILCTSLPLLLLGGGAVVAF